MSKSPLTDEEIQLILEHRRKKKLLEQQQQQQQEKPQQQIQEVELSLKEIEQEISEEEDLNYCANCGWKLENRPERCPQCDVELDWGE